MYKRVKHYFRFFWILLLPFSAFSQTTDSVIARINGEPVTTTEFRNELKKHKAEVYSYFSSRNKLNDDFNWSSSYNGETPLDRLKKRAFESLTKTKVQLLLMKEKGLMSDISYDAFLRNLEETNKKRLESVQNKQPVYGPVQYSENNYFNYLFTNNVIRLKELMAGREISLEETDLKNFYDTIKTKLFKVPDDKLYERYYLSLPPSADSLKRSLLTGQLMKAREHLVNGLPSREVLKITNEGKVPVVKFQTGEDKGEKTERKETEADSTFYYSRRLALNEVSPIFEEQGNLNIIRIIQVKDNGFRPYAEVKKYLAGNLIDRTYTEIINNKAKQAKVEINQSLVDKISFP